MSEWVVISDPSQWVLYKAELEKIPHFGEPTHYPFLVQSNYDCAGSAWKHIFVYQDDAEQLFGAE